MPRRWKGVLDLLCQRRPDVPQLQTRETGKGMGTPSHVQAKLCAIGFALLPILISFHATASRAWAQEKVASCVDPSELASSGDVAFNEEYCSVLVNEKSRTEDNQHLRLCKNWARRTSQPPYLVNVTSPSGATKGESHINPFSRFKSSC